MIKNAKVFIKHAPLFIPNKIIFWAFTLISFFTGHVSKKLRKEHYRENGDKNIDSRIFCIDKYIENQAEWIKVKLGSGKHSNMEYSGCTIIAVYNALLNLKDGDRNILNIIDDFEKKGLALKGDFGISPFYAYRFFKKRGYKAKYITSRNKDLIRSFGDKFDTFIVTFYWDKKNIFNKLHTVNISKSDDGFVAHNMYFKKSDGKYHAKEACNDLFEAVEKLSKSGAPISIIGIKRQKMR